MTSAGHILFADDEPGLRMLAVSALRKAGFDVTAVANGAEALQQFREHTFDLVILDVGMPLVDGHAACTQLRALAGRELPIVMVTGMDDFTSIERAYESGATDFMAKPLSWSLLAHRIKYLLRSHQVLLDLHNANARNAAIADALRHSEASMHQAQAVARLGMWSLDLRTMVLTATPEVSRIYHLPDDVPPSYEAIANLIHPDDRGVLARAWQDTRSGRTYQVEYRITTPGDVRWVQVYARAELDAAGKKALRCVGTVQDITERKLQQLEVASAKSRLQATLDAIPDLLFELDADGHYHACHMPLYKPALQFPCVIGRTVAQTLPPEAAEGCMDALRDADMRGFSTGRQIRLVRPDSSVAWYELSVARKVASAEQARFVMLARDITERKDAESRIHDLAYYDSLTRLPSRQAFIERLEREIQRAAVSNRKLGVLFLDLDGFKNINDTLGHVLGDRVLQEVAERLVLGVRPTDMLARDTGPAFSLARLGGDEFTVLVSDIKAPEDALVVAERVRTLLRQPYRLDHADITLSASIGIALYPDDGADGLVLLQHAHSALHCAKDEGRDTCQFYRSSMTMRAVERMQLDSQLRLALEREEFFLVYQPQYSTQSGQVLTLEALVRWRHPEKGLVSPAQFIPRAEENGLIVPLGEWVLRAACRDLARWRQQHGGLRVAVNLSPRQFRNPALLDMIRAILAETRLPSAALELEVTEGTLMDNDDATLRTLQDLRAMGVSMALDDFGTGYSSLSYLKRLPLSHLKVDQSFVRGLPDSKDSLAIVRAILSIARNLGYTVTAEGVESIAQGLVLKELDCDMLQGFYFSRPVTAADVPALLRRRWGIADLVLQTDAA